MKISNVLGSIVYDKVNSKRLATNGNQQITLFSIETGKELPPHASTMDAMIVVLEGALEIHIDSQDQVLNTHDLLTFGRNQEHKIRAITNCSFLLIQS